MRPPARPSAAPVNLSGLNEISNKVTPVMLAPVNHLLPIEPSVAPAAPRDAWDDDLAHDPFGNALLAEPAAKRGERPAARLARSAPHRQRGRARAGVPRVWRVARGGELRRGRAPAAAPHPEAPARSPGDPLRRRGRRLAPAAARGPAVLPAAARGLSLVAPAAHRAPLAHAPLAPRAPCRCPRCRRRRRRPRRARPPCSGVAVGAAAAPATHRRARRGRLRPQRFRPLGRGGAAPLDLRAEPLRQPRRCRRGRPAPCSTSSPTGRSSCRRPTTSPSPRRSRCRASAPNPLGVRLQTRDARGDARPPRASPPAPIHTPPRAPPAPPATRPRTPPRDATARRWPGPRRRRPSWGPRRPRVTRSPRSCRRADRLPRAAAVDAAHRHVARAPGGPARHARHRPPAPRLAPAGDARAPRRQGDSLPPSAPRRRCSRSTPTTRTRCTSPRSAAPSSRR